MVAVVHHEAMRGRPKHLSLAWAAFSRIPHGIARGEVADPATDQNPLAGGRRRGAAARSQSARSEGGPWSNLDTGLPHPG